MKGLFGQFQILCTVLWDVVKMSSEGQHLSLGEIPLPQWVTAWLKRNLDLLLHVYRCAAIDILWYQSAPRMNAHTMVYDWDNSVTDTSRLKIKFLCKKQTKTFSFFFPFLLKLPQEGLNYMKLAGSSVTQLIVFILSFWQPSVIPDVISLTTWKNSY